MYVLYIFKKQQISIEIFDKFKYLYISPIDNILNYILSLEIDHRLKYFIICFKVKYNWQHCALSNTFYYDIHIVVMLGCVLLLLVFRCLCLPCRVLLSCSLAACA